MTAPQNFRSAFNGFNREDVVHYLEYLNAKHTSQVNQLNSEADTLRKKIQELEDSMEFQVVPEDRSREVDALQAQVEALKAEKEELAQKCAQLEAREAARPEVKEENMAERELEAYRRAERAERVATQRADEIYQRVSTVLGDASGRIETASADLTNMADRVNSQLMQLQSAVSASKLALRDAANTMYALRPTGGKED